MLDMFLSSLRFVWYLPDCVICEHGLATLVIGQVEYNAQPHGCARGSRVHGRIQRVARAARLLVRRVIKRIGEVPAVDEGV